MVSNFDPIEILMKEHEEALKQLALMKSASLSIQQNGFSIEAFEQIAFAINFIDLDIRNHNEREEQFLFPLIGKYVMEPTMVMIHEHRELWKRFSELSLLVKNVKEGKIQNVSIPQITKLVNFIVEFLSSHIEKENRVLFPMTKQMLSKEEYTQLSNDFKKALEVSN